MFSVKRETHSKIVLSMVLFVVALCVFAIFSTPSMTFQGPSQIAVKGPSNIMVIVIGLAIGCYGTIVGIGGGPLIIPMLVLFYGWTHEVLVATSLFIVFLNAASGTVGYAAQRRIDYPAAIKFALAALPGAVISGFVHHAFNIKMFDVIFAVFLIMLAVFSYLKSKDIGKKKTFNFPGFLNKRFNFRKVQFTDSFGVKYKFYSNDNVGIGMNLLLGFFVGFLGIGGGVFQMPILLFLLNYPAHVATATSHFITMLTCFIALIPHAFLGNIFFGEALWMGLGIVFGAQIGARLAPKINSKLLVNLYIFVLLVFAFKLLF